MMRVWADRRLQVSLAATAIVLILGLGVGLSVWTSAQTASMLDQVREDLNRKDYGSYYREMAQYQIDAQVKIWTTIGQFVTAAALVIGGVIAWRNLRVGQENLRVAQENARVAQENLRATQQKLDIDRESQITNRFTQAVGQLGAELKDGTPNLEVRLGGIYALERIARDSPRDHWTIMEVLTAYIRRNAPWPQPASMDAA